MLALSVRSHWIIRKRKNGGVIREGRNFPEPVGVLLRDPNSLES